MQRNPERALARCALWLLVGFVGATAVAAGLLQLFEGDVLRVAALTLVASGATLTVMSWRRGRAVLAEAERPRSRAVRASTRSQRRLAIGTRHMRDRV